MLKALLQQAFTFNQARRYQEDMYTYFSIVNKNITQLLVHIVQYIGT